MIGLGKCNSHLFIIHTEANMGRRSKKRIGRIHKNSEKKRQLKKQRKPGRPRKCAKAKSSVVSTFKDLSDVKRAVLATFLEEKYCYSCLLNVCVYTVIIKLHTNAYLQLIFFR